MSSQLSFFWAECCFFIFLFPSPPRSQWIVVSLGRKNGVIGHSCVLSQFPFFIPCRFRDIIRIVKRHPEDFAYDANAEEAEPGPLLRPRAPPVVEGGGSLGPAVGKEPAYFPPQIPHLPRRPP